MTKDTPTDNVENTRTLVNRNVKWLFMVQQWRTRVGCDDYQIPFVCCSGLLVLLVFLSWR